VQKELAIYIAVGEGSKALDDAKKIHKPLETARDGSDVAKGLLMQTFPTNRQGTQLLGTADLKIAERVAQFFKETVGKRNLPWKERKSPFE
jgi:hypothetical protein